jgi:hypothetical protein
MQDLPVTYVDMLPISLYDIKLPWFTVLIQGEYILFCQYFFGEILTSDEENKLYKCKTQPIPVVSYGNLGSLFHNSRDQNFIYASMVSPPGVLEIRVDDPINAFINRIYQVGEANYVRFIG